MWDEIKRCYYIFIMYRIINKLKNIELLYKEKTTKITKVEFIDNKVTLKYNFKKRTNIIYISIPRAFEFIINHNLHRFKVEEAISVSDIEFIINYIDNVNIRSLFYYDLINLEKEYINIDRIKRDLESVKAIK